MSTTDRTANDMIDVVREAIERVAPDVDARTIDVTADYREEAELDSMDFLTLITTVEERTGVAVPELDYPEVMTIERFAAYLLASSPPTGRQ
jgi:acyl carrier protein